MLISDIIIVFNVIFISFKDNFSNYIKYFNFIVFFNALRLDN